MATYNLEDQEKIDNLKSWWDSYGTWVVIVISVFIATFAGSQGWKYYQQQQRIQAADLYVLLQQVQQSEDVIKINDAAYLLMEGYPSSGYAPRAGMIAARANVDAGDIKKAKENLQWVLNNAKEIELKDLVRLRLASLLLDEKNYNEALKILDTRHGDAFAGLYADLKGDIYVAAGQNEEAQLAYQAAIDLIGTNSNYHNIVQMKLDALGEVSES
ncbi:MAG: tetratricopeptide repeat protein [Nitrosomonas sp.]|nr:tetratricopeptide repeat protein [Nitrosomonas sp.]